MTGEVDVENGKWILNWIGWMEEVNALVLDVVQEKCMSDGELRECWM